MKVNQLMSRKLTTVTRETTLDQVAKLMCNENIGALPVVDEGRPVGIITDRDIVCRSLAQGEDPCTQTAEECMTRDLIMVEKNADISECLDMMEHYQLRRMLVIDNQQQLCGIVAQADIAREASQADKAELLEKVSL